MRLKLLFLAMALLTPSVLAASYVMIHDDVLTDQARLVLVGGVDRVESIVGNPPFTRYHIRAERVLKGQVEGATVAVDVMGGLYPDGSRLILSGSFSFAPQDRLILFLVPRANGSYGVLHLGLGAFRELTVGNRKIARRLLGDAVEIRSGTSSSEQFHQPRDFQGFAQWLEDYSAGSRRRIDYFVSASEMQIPATSDFRLLSQPGRHDKFDKGETVEFVANAGGQPGLAGGGTAELNAAMDAWNDDLNTNIDLELVGTVQANPGFAEPNGENNISYDDPLNEIDGTYTCEPGGGGILGRGGSSVGTPIHIYGDASFFTILESDVVMNDGVRCEFENGDGDTEAAEVYAHEIGHTLLLGHSCGEFMFCTGLPVKNDALMRALAHFDRRGARLGLDDRLAAAALYSNPTKDFAVAIFAQYINGDISGTPNSTRVVARNNGTQTDSGRINFQDATGKPQAVPVSISGSAPSGAQTFVNYSIPVGGVFDVETTGTGPVVQGSIEIVSNLGADSRLEATEAFEVLGDFVSVPSATLAAVQQVFVSVNSDENTGFAAYNPNLTGVDMNICMIDDDGNERADVDMSIDPRERIAIFVDHEDLFQGFLNSVGNNFTGTMRISTENGEVLAILGLLQKKLGSRAPLIAVETSTNVAQPES